MADAERVWWRPGGRSPFSLDPAKPRLPQIATAIFQFSVVFGGPLIGLVTIKYFPFLIEDRTLYIGGLGSIGVCFLASFLCFGDSSFPRGIPTVAKLLFRAGWALSITFWLLGISGIANGYGTPLVTREAAVVAKHPTLERDPARRVYYVAVRPWPQSRDVVELGASRAVYARLDVPITAIDTPQATLDAMQDAAYVRLVLGEGRLGLEWLKQIDLP
jgi:hypothetical protein